MCAHPDCTDLTQSSHCPAHTTHRWGKGAKRTTTARHQAWSKAVRQRDQHCMIQLPGCTGAADTADHIHAVAFGGKEFDLTNGRAACWHCHNRKSSREGHQAQGHQPKPL